MKHSSKLEAAVDGEISASHRDEEISVAAERGEGLEPDFAKQNSVELNPFKRETGVLRSNGMDGDVAELHADLDDRLHQLNIDPMRVDEVMQQTAAAQKPATTSIANSADKQERRRQETERGGTKR